MRERERERSKKIASLFTYQFRSYKLSIYMRTCSIRISCSFSQWPISNMVIPIFNMCFIRKKNNPSICSNKFKKEKQGRERKVALKSNKERRKKALNSRIVCSLPLKLLEFRSCQRHHIMQCGTSFQIAIFYACRKTLAKLQTYQ